MTIADRDERAVAPDYAGSMDPRLSFTVWRVAAWAGPVFLAALGLGFAGVAGFLPPPKESWSAVETQAWFTGNQDRIRVGMAIYLLFVGLYAVWSAAIARAIERIEGRRGLLAQCEFGGGVATTVVAAIAGVMWFAAAFRPEERSPEDVQLLMDVGWLIFNTTFSVTAVQMLAIGAAVMLDRRRDPLFPKWITWIAIAFSTTFIPLLLIPFFETGPFAWDGLFNYYIALGGAFTFDAIVAFYLFGAIRKVEREELG